MNKLYTDGGSRGNPGNAAIGFFLWNDSELIDFAGGFIGSAETNNKAEYLALINGLKLAKKHNVEDLECYLDSELVVKQLNGEYRVKHKDIIPLHKKVTDLITEFKSVSFNHVPRAQNKHADRMVNIILDSVENK